MAAPCALPRAPPMLFWWLQRKTTRRNRIHRANATPHGMKSICCAASIVATARMPARPTQSCWNISTSFRSTSAAPRFSPKITCLLRLTRATAKSRPFCNRSIAAQAHQHRSICNMDTLRFVIIVACAFALRRAHQREVWKVCDHKPRLAQGKIIHRKSEYLWN